jgi:hypothetical protein
MLFFLPSKRGFNFAKIRGFKVTDYTPLRQLRLDGTAPSSIERLVPSRRSLPVDKYKLLTIKYESKVVITNRHFELLRDQFRMAINNQ